MVPPGNILRFISFLASLWLYFFLLYLMNQKANNSLQQINLKRLSSHSSVLILFLAICFDQFSDCFYRECGCFESCTIGFSIPSAFIALLYYKKSDPQRTLKWLAAMKVLLTPSQSLAVSSHTKQQSFFLLYLFLLLQYIFSHICITFFFLSHCLIQPVSSILTGKSYRMLQSPAISPAHSSSHPLRML